MKINLTLRQKLLLPGFILGGLALVLVLFIISLNAKIKKINQTTLDNTYQYEKLHSLREHIQVFLDLNDQFEELNQELNSLSTMLSDIKHLRGVNDRLYKEMNELLSNAGSIASNYIKLTSERLMDENKRYGVTTLERAVINGARISTEGTYKFQLLLHNFRQEISLGQEIDNVLKATL
jgi:cell shape-determining protein MreC